VQSLAVAVGRASLLESWWENSNVQTGGASLAIRAAVTDRVKSRWASGVVHGAVLGDGCLIGIERVVPTA